MNPCQSPEVSRGRVHDAGGPGAAINRGPRPDSQPCPGAAEHRRSGSVSVATSTGARPSRRSAVVVLATSAVVTALVLAGCTSGTTVTDPPSGSSSTSAAPPPEGPDITVAYFTDSWGAGSHCSGCTPWPRELAPAYEKTYGVHVTPLDFANPAGSNTDLLLNSLKTDQKYRDAVAAADVVVFNHGLNDFDQFDKAVFVPLRNGHCGGGDGLACLQKLTDHWTQNLAGYAAVVKDLRGDKPTAVRFVGISNEYLTDPVPKMILGGAKNAQAVFAGFNDVSCAVAEEHDGVCVDLRPVLNGPTMDAGADPNSPESMQAVADAIVALGLPELGIEKLNP